jgi:glycosyltransferase involved in cell wall biosynthesis
MPVALQTFTRISTRDNSKPLNILTAPTHERYESGLAKTGHRFYAWQGPGIKGWNEKFAPIPENYHILDGRKMGGQLPLHVDIDLVLSQNKWGQLEPLSIIARQLQVPLITLEHTLPAPNMVGKGVQKYIQNMKGDLDIFISEYSIDKWGWKRGDTVEVVHHGIDTDLFKPNPNIEREDLVCSVVNDWINRDWCCGFKMWQQATDWPNSNLKLNVWGDTKGLSKPAEGVVGLVKEYQRSLIFLNTSLISPVPTVLLEAMSSGCAVVSTDTCMIPEFIKHGENGFMGKNPAELRYYVDLLLKDKALARQMGNKARQTIVEHFSLDKFINRWNEVFRKLI